VPHYLPVAPNPKAALALADKACGVLGTSVDRAAIERAVRRWEIGVARLLDENEELGEYASRLESGDDSDTDDEDEPSAASALEDVMDEPSIPSGDAIAAEFERFLRQQAPGEPGAEP
jgi:hypothetical protein